jgi:inhibitor of cysteine peptidase
MPEIRVDPTRGSAPFQARVGDVLVLELAENPTTGYRWQVPPDAPAALISDEYLPPLSSAAGAGGKRILKFGVALAGEHAIRLQLRREWETSAQEMLEIRFRAD